MPYEETSKEKAKREAYMKANKERGIRQEAERDYRMFGTTEQNIPQVNPMGDATMPASAGMKKGGKVKKFNDGGMSLEEMYPEAKITRAGPQPKPSAPPENEYSARNREYAEERAKARVDKDTLAPYERKAPAMGKGTRGGGGGGTGGTAADMKMLLNPKAMKKGGKVKKMAKGGSAHSRADGIAQKGHTRGKYC